MSTYPCDLCEQEMPCEVIDGKTHFKVAVMVNKEAARAVGGEDRPYAFCKRCVFNGLMSCIDAKNKGILKLTPMPTDYDPNNH